MKMEAHTIAPTQVDDEGKRYQMRDIGMVKNATHKKLMKVYMDPQPHVILDQNVPLRGWYKAKHEPVNVRPRPCYTEAVLTQPYGGSCPVRCSFCYVNNGTRGYRSQGITVVDPAYPDKVRKQLKRMQTSAAGYLSSFTEPFQELESVYHNTQRTAQAFVDEGLPIFFLSRKEYPGWAYDQLKQNPYSYAQMSINTSNADTWRKLSPFALDLDGMVDQVRSLHAAGIYVSVQVNPIIPGVQSNEDIVALIHRLAQAGADHLIFKFAEIVHSSKQEFLRQMKMRHGEEAYAVLQPLFQQSIGGVTTIEESYRIEALRLFKAECAKAGVTMGTCYEYRYDRRDDGSIINKTGIPVGDEFMTAAQCHGQRVPMFTRPEAEKPFQEVTECPPAGCLTCSDATGTASCGSEFFGSASAIQPAGFNIPVWSKK